MILELLKNRTSVRVFQDRPIAADVLHTILEAGRLSPSGGNEQPWRFGVITERELITRIADIAYQQSWMARAPLLVVLCTVGVGGAPGGRNIQRERFPSQGAAIARMEQELYWALNQEEHQTKIAGTHMVLAALEQGVGSCWVSRFDVKQLARLLDLPGGCMPSEILVFGYPVAKSQPTAKKSLDEVVFHNAFGRHP